MDLTARIARERTIGVLFTEHDMDVVFGHADRVLVLNRGTLIAEGAPAAVRANAEVQAVYLGAGSLYGAASLSARQALGRRPRRGLWPSAGAVRRLAWRSPPARRSRCSAATARANRQRSAPYWGLCARRSGTIVFDGEDISKRPAYEIVRRGLGYVPEDRRIFSDLTVEENLQVGRQPPRTERSHLDAGAALRHLPELARIARRAGARMSGGEQQMLTIARTLMGNPSLLLLDEPSEGLAPRIVEQMIEAIREMKREGLSLFVSEQNLAFARLVAERVYVIEKGAIRFGGTMAEFDARPDVRRLSRGLRCWRRRGCGTRCPNEEPRHSRPPRSGAALRPRRTGRALRCVRRSSVTPTIFAAKMIEDLTPTQWAALAKLREVGDCSQNHLGRLTAMDAATIKGVIDRLTARGFTMIRPDPHDGRRILVALTPPGSDLYDRAAPIAALITEETLRAAGRGRAFDVGRLATAAGLIPRTITVQIVAADHIHCYYVDYSPDSPYFWGRN